MMKFSPCSALLLFVLVSWARAEPPAVIKELISQMRAELQTDMKAARDNDRSGDRQWQLSSMLLQIERAFDEEAAATYDVSQLTGALLSFAASEKMQQLAQALTNEIGREFAVREKAATAELDKLIETQVTPALEAKTAAEIDAPLAALQKAQGQARYRRETRGMQSASERLSNAVNFLTSWQDYLAAKESGRLDQARSALSNLTNSGRQYSFVPRSKLLALQNAANPNPTGGSSSSGVYTTVREPGSSTWKRVDGAISVTSEDPGSIIQILQKIKTLDELVAAKSQLDFQRARNSEESTLASAATSMADSYERIRRGQTSSWRITSTDALYSPKLAHLWEQFFAFALPRVLSLEAEAATPKAGENIADCLKRLLTEAKKVQDWSLVGRIVSAGRSLNIFEYLASTKDSAALSQFMTGLNQERAKQFSMAVVSFEAALKTGSDIVPPEVIGEHLEQIRKEHPAEYQLGLQAALTSPAPSTDRPATSPVTTDPRARVDQ